ncbi:MAG TPA: sensor histidine kinase [Rhodopila sp.]|uniref:sensor histidine kinase n=1 Tax=Rhodopila sp. TaxID=2480087 RepID=UPI002C31FC4C|nr:sensor histidine kinase [Rhodopila sp.]HVY14233.1 sensor histidine kinase [Rhodopila sp.]
MDEPEQNDMQPEQIDQLLDMPDLAGALESERFKQFLDHLPVAIAVSELQPSERIVYSNAEFERLSNRTSRAIVGRSWQILPGRRQASGKDELLGDLIVGGSDFIGTFAIDNGDDAPHVIDAWSNIIEDDEGTPTFRLVALIGRFPQTELQREELEQRIREKDTLLRELQHRVKNNLQMITALIRLEARNVSDSADGERFDRLAGRVESLALLYRALSDEGQSEEVDLGVYLSQVASAVMKAHATEGIRLELKVDTWPVSVNVAMPAGLVVNELMTNALKHAFEGRDGGTIKLHSLVDDIGCKVIIADDGVGLPSGVEWPEPGKLSALIVKSLRENARAKLEVDSKPDIGTTVTIRFTRAAATEG